MAHFFDWKKINWKRFLAAFAAVFVLANLLGFVIHGTILKADYQAVAQLWRPDAERMAFMPWMWFATALFSWAFVWVYAYGWEEKPWWGQGLRYAIAAWLLAGASIYLMYYSVQPLPWTLVNKQILFELLSMLVLGLATAWIYRPAWARSPSAA